MLRQLKRDQVAPLLREPAALPDRRRGLRQQLTTGPASCRRWAWSTDGAPVRRPYVKSNKNDAADAEAICEAVSRPSMRLCRSERRAAVGALAATASARASVKGTHRNKPDRGLLGEYGLAVPGHRRYPPNAMPSLIEDAENELPGTFRLLIQRPLDHLRRAAGAERRDRSADQAWHRPPARPASV